MQMRTPFALPPQAAVAQWCSKDDRPPEVQLKIETVRVLPAEVIGLLDSVECLPVIHCPSLATMKR
jgi:hypothetical protein